MLIVGEKETEENKVSVRRRGEGDLGMMDVDNFVERVVEAINEELK